MTSRIIVNNIQSDAGVSTVFFNSDIGGTSGTLNVDGNLNVGGVITYDDVTNIDSVGIITARSDVSIADKIVHTGDTDTAIRFPGADQVSIETGGTQRLLIGSDGKLVHSSSAAESIDFGTSNGSGSYHKYDLGASGATVGYIGAGSAIVSGAEVADFGVRGQANLVFSSGGDTERLRITSDGGVGIGTTNPVLGRLQVERDIGIYRASSDPTLNFAVGGTIDSPTKTYRILIDDSDDDKFQVRDSSTARITLDGSGKVGINDSSPSVTLDITGQSSGNGEVNVKRTSGATCQIQAQSSIAVFGSSSNHRVDLKSNSTTAATIDTSQRLLLGHTSSRAVGHSSGDGKLQIEGTNLGTSELSIVRNSDNNGAAHIFIGKSRGSSVGDSTVVQDEDSLGVIGFVGADGTDVQTRAAQITAIVDGTPGSNDMPGRLVFSTTSDGDSSPTERLRIDRNGRILKTGTDARSNFFNSTWSPGIQSENTDDKKTALSLVCAGDNANQGILLLGNTRNASVGGNTIVQDDDGTGIISFQGNDGSDMVETARIESKVDGTPGANDMPGRLVFRTTADGAASSTERLRIDSSGRILIGSGAISSPKCNDGGLDVTSHNLSIVFGGSSLSGTTPLRANNATKDGRIAASHYANAEEPVGVVRVISNSTENQVYWGGGSSIINAATDHRFYTAADNTTTGGTERLRIDSNGNFIFKNGALIENGFHDDGGGLTGDYNHDLGTYGNVHFSATNAAGAFTYNLRINGSTTLNSVMAEGDVLSFTLMHASNNSSHYLTQLKIDGSNVSPVWAGGSAPSAATGSGFDVYSFSIMKTGDGTYGIFGTFTNHA